jgi:hypothetical protein
VKKRAEVNDKVDRLSNCRGDWSMPGHQIKRESEGKREYIY